MTEYETAYIDRHQECMALVEQIAAALGDMDAPSERINWCQVGDLARTRDLLRQIAEIVKVE